ncbi:MAG: hypothetical protein ACYSUQ_13955, partial [Planctomycetota bacterium]
EELEASLPEVLVDGSYVQLEHRTYHMSLIEILNHESFLKFLNKLDREFRDDDFEQDGYGCGIDALHLDTKKVSKPGDLYLFMELGDLDWFRVHCKDVRFEEVPD